MKNLMTTPLPSDYWTRHLVNDFNYMFLIEMILNLSKSDKLIVVNQ